MIRRTSSCLFVGLLGLLPQLGCATGPSASNSLVPQLTSPEIKGTKDKGELPAVEAAKANLATAEAFEKSGNALQAIQQYEAARTKDPRLNAKVCRNLARLYDQLGDAQRAMVEYKQCQLDHPRDADLLNDIGYCHYQQGQWQDAERWFRKALDVAPQHQRATINLGMTLGQQGGTHYEEALEVFKRVTSPAEAHVNMAFIYQTHGKREEAKRAYLIALELQPELDLARRALAKLEGPGKFDGSATGLAIGSPAFDKQETTLPKRPELVTNETIRRPEPMRPSGSRLYPPEDRTGPPSFDVRQAALHQQERDADLAELQEFVRKRQAEVQNGPPPTEPPVVPESSVDAKPQAAKKVPMTRPILIGAPVPKARPQADGVPTAVSFE